MRLGMVVRVDAIEMCVERPKCDDLRRGLVPAHFRTALTRAITESSLAETSEWMRFRVSCTTKEVRLLSGIPVDPHQVVTHTPNAESAPLSSFDKSFDKNTAGHPHRVAGRCHTNQSELSASFKPKNAVSRCGYFRTNGLYLIRCG